MASINRLKPGQIVYSVIKQKMGRTTISVGSLYTVLIKEVHEDYVIASWNGNPPHKYYLNEIKKWKVKKPEPKRQIFGVSDYS